ncbi:MAG: hypothetical protein PHU25_22470 [Deltaproteobacteria bacterium]|nr:hypothetical protein [Deltaproteobacteria bacterium]
MRERKTILFGVLNLVQGTAIGAIPVIVPSRDVAVNWALGAVAAVMLVAGPALVFGGRYGRITSAAACFVHLLAGLVATTLIASSAAYLYGIYGAYGRDLGRIAFVVALFALIVFWLIPAHELVWLGNRRKGA